MLAAIDPRIDEDDLVTGLLLGLLRGLWERGWQPADVAHVVRRATTARATRLALAAMAADARAVGAAARAPEEWAAQLSALGVLDGGSSEADLATGVILVWARTEGLPAPGAWRDVIAVLHGLTGLGELQHLCAPPSRWGAGHRRSRQESRPTDARLLGRIRGLLAKAESTDFVEEAEALTAKAQELISRHAVDVAALDADQGVSARGQVRAQRLHIDNPYPEAKVRLINAVAEANGVRVVWLSQLGMVTMVGLPNDLGSVELLYTSLLVQVNRAMTATGQVGVGRSRSAAFRRAFLTAYAVRVGERLLQMREQVTTEASTRTGTDLVPVLRERSQAVDDVFTELFPQIHHGRGRAFDASGWHAGRLAAESADLGTGRGQVSR